MPPSGAGGRAAAELEANIDDAAVAVVSLYQKQQKIYPRAVSGLFMRWRWALVWATQLLFYGLPWLGWNARQAVLFDLAARRFYIGPLVLYPQDFIYLTALLVISAYALFLFTAVAGRLWCGYACPQTVYTEIFMWVERRLEGDRASRMRLDAAPWSFAKLWRKGGTQLAWVVIALWTGFTFVGYFTPIRTLANEALTLSFGPWEWFWVLFYGLATYGNVRMRASKAPCSTKTRSSSPTTPPAASRAGRARARLTRPRSGWAVAWTAACACRSALQESIYARACSTNASVVRHASTSVMA
jgi:hypothetical protein